MIIMKSRRRWRRPHPVVRRPLADANAALVHLTPNIVERTLEQPRGGAVLGGSFPRVTIRCLEHFAFYPVAVKSLCYFRGPRDPIFISFYYSIGGRQ